MTRFSSLLVCLGILLAAPFSAFADEQEQATKYIQSLADRTLVVIEKETNREAKKHKLEALFADSVDIKWVGRFVMGRSWRTATDEQKKRYLKAYGDFILGHYAERFSEYASGKFAITGSSKLADGEYIVNMELQNSGAKDGQPVLVDYKVRKSGKGFLVFDVIIEGVSMITTQRSEFSSVIARDGLDHLIEQLENKSMPIPAA